MTSQRSTISAGIFLNSKPGSVERMILDNHMDEDSFLPEADAIKVILNDTQQTLFSVRDVVTDLKEYHCKVCIKCELALMLNESA